MDRRQFLKILPLGLTRKDPKSPVTLVLCWYEIYQDWGIPPSLRYKGGLEAFVRTNSQATFSLIRNNSTIHQFLPHQRDEPVDPAYNDWQVFFERNDSLVEDRINEILAFPELLPGDILQKEDNNIRSLVIIQTQNAKYIEDIIRC